MALLFIRFSPEFACYIFIIRASDMVLSIFDIMDGFIYLVCTRGPPPKIQWPLVAQKLPNIYKIGKTTSLALITKSNLINFCDNRMYSQGASAASVLSTQSCFSSFEKQYQVFNGLDGLKIPLLVYTNHINNEKHVHHGFLAPWAYLCSTSFKEPMPIFRYSPGQAGTQSLCDVVTAARLLKWIRSIQKVLYEDGRGPFGRGH